jgi:flagellar basal body-associated protein FliL
LEILVIIIIVVLVLAVAGGPLLAMRNPAEADKLTPGADPAHESGKEPDASESTAPSPTPRHTEDHRRRIGILYASACLAKLEAAGAGCWHGSSLGLSMQASEG